MTKLPLVSDNRHSSPVFNGVVMKIESNCGDNDVLFSTGQSDKYLIIGNAIKDELRDSQFTRNGTNGFCIEDRLVLESDTGSIHKSPEKIGNLGNSGEAIGIRQPRRTFSTSILEVSGEMKQNKQIFPFDFLPLWGSVSIRGRRQEMEDAIISKPRFLRIPSWMLSESPGFTSLHRDLIGHVFGVYDGHGGCQVAEYCRERLHMALAEEISIAKENLHTDNFRESKDHWSKVFMNCFRRLDDAVGGFPGDIGSDQPVFPVAPESVGSTAVVAVVCSTHIIVANCGDSRAVLYRGKVSMPLSIDHKPNREDECARIEGAGGKVINWDGYRVSGVLAVSRSIGDRYLRPYVISDPEITFVPRTKEDECLILASDGLWDVMTNDEACDLARRRILLWHKKNHATAAVTATTSEDQGDTADPAAQDAADYLSKLAFRRGSRDNISVIVVDLKAQRKLKKKS